VADDTSPEISYGLTEAHREYLRAHAVDPDLAESLGVRSLTSRADNPQEGVWPNWANHPAILFPWTNEDGRIEYQVRPDDPTTGPSGKRPRKYVFAKEMVPVLWAVRVVRNPRAVLIVEGTKQTLAAATNAPPDVSVYGIAGCRMWQINKQPIPDLQVVDGHLTVVVLDADAATNPEVYEAGVALGNALAMEGAEKVLFSRLPGGDDKAGLDDILATRPTRRRTQFIERLITGARPKPADKAPVRKRKNGEAPDDDGDRTTVIINRDRFEVINDLTAALLKRWNERELFNHGGVISRLGDNAAMAPVDSGQFHDIIQNTAKTVSENEGAQGTTYTFGWPDAGTMKSVMSRADRFAALDRIAHAPFVRPDGSIVSEPGYDSATRTLLVPDPVFDGLTVPESPGPEQIRAAVQLLLTEWLGDFPLDGEPDRANLLALLVTPAIRGMAPRVPMAVIDGLQMGVGKNLLADSLLTVYTGRAAEPMNWVSEPDELRKQITAAFRTGKQFFVFDEAHVLEGAPLAQALTAETWQDRVLGVSTMANFPNRVTWLSLGNNVNVRGDITRRVYRVALRPRYANPQDRPASSFRHPGQSGMDLASWTKVHRRELMTAILTVVRAWFAIGSPTPKRGVSFGSFEVWERIVGGIVETAGLPGFLDNLKVWRSESDFDSQYWTSHLAWLFEQFGGRAFKTGEVKTKALTLGTDLYEAPPRLDDPTEKTYGKALGEAYSRIRSRRYGRYWLERVSAAHGHVSQWQVHSEDELPPPPGLTDPEPPVPGPVCPHCLIPSQGPDWPMNHRLGCPDLDTQESKEGEPVDNPVDRAAIVHDGAPGWLGEMEQALDAIERPHETLSASDPRERDDRDTIGGDESPSVVAFDLETGDAGDQYRHPGPGYTRIGATASDDGPVIDYDDTWPQTVPELVRDDIRRGRVITGHNIMAFDLPVLVREGVMTMPEIHHLAAEGRLFDGILAGRYLDPPMARDKGVDVTRRYGLGPMGERYGLGEKLSDVSKELAKRYGGWDKIPIDDSEDGRAFKAYMCQDVELSRRLYHELNHRLANNGDDLVYLKREHRVAAIAAQISVNGFLVDQQLLGQRIAEIEQRKADAMATLSGEYGVPTHDEKGRPYLAPLASKAGKLALEQALIDAGVPPKSLWKTEKAKDLQVSADAMLHYGREYADKPGVRAIARAVWRIVSSRTVYETIRSNMMPDGRVHPSVDFRQATGRWSLTKPGLTVMGKRGGRHVERAVLLPDPGEVLIAVDLSQVDMRAVAGLSQDQAYISMLRSEDPHSDLAIALFGDAKFRESAKAIGHGWNYGESLRRISEDNEIPADLVMQFDRSMRDRFGRLVEWREEVRAIASSGALLDNGFGRSMRPDPQRAHTQGPALMGQGAARDLMMEGLLRLPSEILPMLRAQVHDEVVLSVPAADAEEIGRVVVEALSFEWKGVPITADVSRPGTDWSKCYEKG